MKQIKSLFLLVFLFISIINYSQDFIWANDVGGEGGVFNNNFTVIDTAGNLYTTGSFNGTVDFNPDEEEVFNLTSLGKQDIYIQKIDADGHFVWAINIGGDENDIGKSINIDLNNHIYITGSYTNTVDFDPSAENSFQTSNGDTDVFILKLNDNGDFIWVKSFGDVDKEIGNDIEIDSSGNIYTKGSFYNSVDFDPGVGVLELTSNGEDDFFIQKLDSDGNFIWAISFGSNYHDDTYKSDLAISDSGNIYTSGSFTSIVDFDPSEDVFEMESIGYNDIFIQKLDTNGNFIWVKTIEDDNGHYTNSMTIDSSENIYTTGYFTGNIDFDPSTNVFELTSLGSSDSFIVKLDLNGNFVWAKSYGISGSETIGKSISIDNSGNVLVTGNFQNTVDFDPSANVFELSSNGKTDIFIQKLNSAGNFIGAKSFGGGFYDDSSSIRTDSFDNIYVTGLFQSTTDFNPDAGAFEISSKGNSDYFIQKLDINADFQWVKSIDGLDTAFGNSIVTDEYQNVYTAGYFTGTVDFNPQVGVFEMTSNGSYDMFIQKIDANGNFVWAKSMGGNAQDSYKSISIDPNGNLYLTGYYNDSVDFDPSDGTSIQTTNGKQNTFIQKFDSDGTFIWVKCLATEGIESWSGGNSITVDNEGNIFTTGYFLGTYDFNPGPSFFEITSNGYFDIFVLKLDTTGNFIWAKAVGGSGFDLSYSISVDALGFVYTAGRYKDVVDFNPGSEVFYLNSNGSSDVFIQKLDTNGSFIWAKSFGGSGTDKCTDISIDNSSNIYMTGYFSNTVDFNPNAGVSELTSNGFSDIFIEKIDHNGNFIWAKSMGANKLDKAFSISNDILGNVYTTGYFSETVDFNPGAAIYNLTAIGDSDIFIQTLSPEGDFLWANRFGGDRHEGSQDITTDSQGNVYTTGNFLETVDFDSSAATYNLTTTSYNNAFILKLKGAVIGVKDKKIEEILIYPNPSIHTIYVEIDDNLVKNIQLFNLSGNMVSQSKTNKIDISPLSSGIYILKIRTIANEIISRKLIKK